LDPGTFGQMRITAVGSGPNSAGQFVLDSYLLTTTTTTATTTTTTTTRHSCFHTFLSNPRSFFFVSINLLHFFLHDYSIFST